MFFVEYTENNEKKALNLAMCKTIEMSINELASPSKSTYSIIITHENSNSTRIKCESKDTVISTFNSLIDAVKACQTMKIDKHGRVITS